MLVHIIVLMLVCFFGIGFYHNYGGRTVRNRHYYFILFSEFVIFFVIAFRAYSVGEDTPTYYYAYKRIALDPTFAQRLGWEPLYVIINLIAAKLGSFQWVMIICAIITCTGFGYFIYHNTQEDDSAFWFLFFYITLNLYFNSMHLMRQICAMAFSVNIYTVLTRDRTKKGIIKSIVLLALGLGFHVTAVFSLVCVIPLFLQTINRKTIILMFLVGLGALVILPYAQSLMIRLVPRFSRYINSSKLDSSRAGIFSLVMIVLKLAMVGFALTLDPKEPMNRRIYDLTFVMVFSTLFYLMQFRTQFALRLGYYYEIFFPIYIPAFIKRIRGKTTRSLAFAAMFLFGLTYFIYMMASGKSGSNRATVPYYFFWQI